MDFHDFPRCLGKSGVYLIQPPKLCAGLVPRKLRGVLAGVHTEGGCATKLFQPRYHPMHRKVHHPTPIESTGGKSFFRIFFLAVLLAKWSNLSTHMVDSAVGISVSRADILQKGHQSWGLQSTQVGKAIANVFCGALIRSIS